MRRLHSDPADKGRSTVVMDKSYYEKKAMDLLSDTNTYRKLPQDPVTSLERCMNALLLSLKWSGVIPDHLYSRLRSSAGRIPLFYGLPKVQKPTTYIGQTGRTLQHRLKEHKYALTSGHVWNSAVAEHAANTRHAIKWDGAEVIDSHPHLKQRCVLEAWHIQKQAHTINREHGQLPQAYHHLVHATNTVTNT